MVVIEYDVVVVLFHVVTQAEMLGKESHQLVTRSVVSDHGRLRVHVFKHDIEELPALASPLDARVDKEVED